MQETNKPVGYVEYVRPKKYLGDKIAEILNVISAQPVVAIRKRSVMLITLREEYGNRVSKSFITRLNGIIDLSEGLLRGDIVMPEPGDYGCGMDMVPKKNIDNWRDAMTIAWNSMVTFLSDPAARVAASKNPLEVYSLMTEELKRFFVGVENVPSKNLELGRRTAVLTENLCPGRLLATLTTEAEYAYAIEYTTNAPQYDNIGRIEVHIELPGEVEAPPVSEPALQYVPFSSAFALDHDALVRIGKLSRTSIKKLSLSDAKALVEVFWPNDKLLNVTRDPMVTALLGVKDDSEGT